MATPLPPTLPPDPTRPQPAPAAVPGSALVTARGPVMPASPITGAGGAPAAGAPAAGGAAPAPAPATKPPTKKPGTHSGDPNEGLTPQQVRNKAIAKQRADQRAAAYAKTHPPAEGTTTPAPTPITPAPTPVPPIPAPNTGIVGTPPGAGAAGQRPYGAPLSPQQEALRGLIQQPGQPPQLGQQPQPVPPRAVPLA